MFGELPKEPLLQLLRFNSYHGHLKEMKYSKIVQDRGSHCQFNNRFYKPPKALAMESPITPVSAEIFMNHFRNRILKGSRFWSMIKLWAR